MGIIDALVRQSGKPSGVLGRIMVKIMNQMDSGLNQWIIEKINFPTGKALDIGCGGGETLSVLLKQNKIDHIVGIDYSMDSVRVAKAKNSTFIKKGRADIIQGNVVALPFAQGHFDCILAVRSHYFWDDLEKGFAEIYRTLKQDGKMMIFSERYKIQYHMNKYQSDDGMTSLLQTLGFRNILIENRNSTQCITASK